MQFTHCILELMKQPLKEGSKEACKEAYLASLGLSFATARNLL